MRWVLLVLLLLVLVGVWLLAFFVPDLRWFAEALTGAVVGIPLLVVLVLWVRDRVKRERAAEPRLAVPPSKRPELAAMRTHLRAALAQVRRARGGSAGVDRLPWYIALGPQAAGRSTMLDRLGLTKMTVPAPAKDVEPPPFDLWCSSEAVFVDASGRMADEGERERWLALLRELRRMRGDRAIDGVVLTMGVSDLQAAVDADLQHVGGRLRARLDEVLDELGVVLPVYVVLTKADLLPGFTEFWTGDSTAEDSTWGASFGVTDDTAVHEPAKAVQRELEQLAQALHARLLERLPQEGDPRRRVRVLRFPVEFRAIEAPLARFVEGLCRPGPAPERFVLRGVYLTSAGEAGSKGRFLTDLLRSVVLPDRNLSTPTVAASRRRARGGVVLSAISLVGLAALLVPALTSYVHQADLAHAAEAAAVALSGSPDSAPGMQGDPIEPALDTLTRLEEDAHSFGIPGWFGPRATGDLSGALTDAYVARLNAWMTNRLRPELEKRLDAIVWGPPLTDSPTTPDDRTSLMDAYQTVRLCAALAEPERHAQEDWAAVQLAAEWRKLLPDAGAVGSARLTEHARRYLQALARHPAALAWPIGGKLADARTRLKRLDVRDMPYRRLLLWAQGEAPVRASDIFGQASLEFLASRGDVQVSGTFTANGWRKISDALRSKAPWPPDAVVEGWVLDDSSVPADDRALRDEVRARYFDDFAEHWLGFLSELRVEKPPDLDTARRELTAFKAETFYKTLFTQLKANAIHDDTPPPDDAGAWTSRIPWLGKSTSADAAAAATTTGPSSVEKAFRPFLAFAGMADDGKAAAGGAAPAPLDKYLAILDGLKADLGAAPTPQVSLDEEQSHLTQAKTGVTELLDGVPDPARRTLAQLLLPPIMGGVSAGTNQGQQSLSDDWRTMVWTAWNEKLSGHFPFKASATSSPANFADFAKFFRPDGDGILWGFVHTRLATMIEQKGDGQYVPKQGADPLAPDALMCLTVAQEISDAFFHVGEQPGLKLSIEADWNAPDVTDAKIVVAGKETPLPRGQWSAVLRWFGEDVNIAWKQSGRPTQELGRHSFSLFDLFTSLGGLHASGGRALYTADCPPLSLEVRPEGKDAFRPDFFTRLHCPQDLRILKP